MVLKILILLPEIFGCSSVVVDVVVDGDDDGWVATTGVFFVVESGVIDDDSFTMVVEGWKGWVCVVGEAVLTDVEGINSVDINVEGMVVVAVVSGAEGTNVIVTAGVKVVCFDAAIVGTVVEEVVVADDTDVEVVFEVAVVVKAIVAEQLSAGLSHTQLPFSQFSEFVPYANKIKWITKRFCSPHDAIPKLILIYQGTYIEINI